MMGALAAVLSRDLATLLALVATGLLAHFLATRSFRSGLRRLAPILIFAGVLAGLQWLGGAAEPRLALKAVAVFVLVVPAVRLVRWDELLARREPGSPLFGAALFLLLVRHFVRVFAEEARRLLTAQGLAAPRRWRHGWWASLVWALVALFRRALARAERFYAAQLVRGLES
jgi:hypothetical protein